MQLVEAAKQGKLEVRADASRFKFSFNEMVAGLNDVLDAVVGPLNVAARCVDDISRGAIPENHRIVSGRFQHPDKQFEYLHRRREPAGRRYGQAQRRCRGRKTVGPRGCSAHQGDFRKIVQGVNDTLDSVVGPLNEATAVLEEIAARNMTVRVQGAYRGDLAKIKQALNPQRITSTKHLCRQRNRRSRLPGQASRFGGQPIPCPGRQRTGIQPGGGIVES